MTSQKITTLCLTDLESAVIGCQDKDCGMRLSMKLGTRKQVPENCPSCGKPLDVKSRSILIEFLGFYCRPEVSSAKIEIQVRPETEKEKTN